MRARSSRSERPARQNGVPGSARRALEAELHRYKAKQSRYLILPQFMSGMMVGLGLFGTFIGLLGALAEIGKLIGAFRRHRRQPSGAAIPCWSSA